MKQTEYKYVHLLEAKCNIGLLPSHYFQVIPQHSPLMPPRKHSSETACVQQLKAILCLHEPHINFQRLLCVLLIMSGNSYTEHITVCYITATPTYPQKGSTPRNTWHFQKPILFNKLFSYTDYIYIYIYMRVRIHAYMLPSSWQHKPNGVYHR